MPLLFEFSLYIIQFVRSYTDILIWTLLIFTCELHKLVSILETCLFGNVMMLNQLLSLYSMASERWLVNHKVWRRKLPFPVSCMNLGEWEKSWKNSHQIETETRQLWNMSQTQYCSADLLGNITSCTSLTCLQKGASKALPGFIIWFPCLVTNELLILQSAQAT